MSEEDKLILGTLAGVDLVLSPEHYEEYKGTLNEQLEEKDKEIDRLNNLNKQLVEECQKLDDEETRLNNIIDTMLEFNFFKEECPLNFGFGDEKEEKAQDVFYEDNYCEENCNDIYKKCWLKYFEKLQELKENNNEKE